MTSFFTVRIENVYIYIVINYLKIYLDIYETFLINNFYLLYLEKSR